MKRLLTILFAICIISSVFSQEERLVDQIRNHKSGTGIWWIGHDTWIIKTGNLVFVTDIFIEDKTRIAPSPITPEEVASVVDISFVSHSHGDHFNVPNSRVLLEKSKCLFVLPESCLDVARKIKIPDERIVIAKPRVPMEVKGMKVLPMRALHGNKNYTISYEANMQDCGYLFTINGKTYLQMGDTYLLEDHLFLKKVNVLFFSPTEHNTYIDPSVILINNLDPDYIFPQHHSTVAVTESNRFWANGYPDEVKMRLSKPMQEKYHILKIGEKFVIP
jgi:L-ascorbate 6-phosphate lactonase